jgi:hypothetical protein
MEEEKKVEEGKSEEKIEEKTPVITRSIAESMETECMTCGVDEKPPMPQNLPEPDWPTEKLVEALKDPHMLVRSNAVMILSKRSPSEAIEPLIEALKDKEYLVKSNAMVALASFGHQIFDRMLEAMSDSDGDVRAGASWIMGELKDPRAVDALEKVAKDDYPLARIQAKASLMAMGEGPKKEARKETPVTKAEQPEEKKE